MKEAETPEDIVAIMIERYRGEGYIFTEAQEAELKALMVRKVTEVCEFIDARNLRQPWVTEANSPADIRDREINHRHRRLTHGNGSRVTRKPL